MMSKVNSDDYYRARIKAEKQAAVDSACPQAKRAHEEMAVAYEQLVAVRPGRAA